MTTDARPPGSSVAAFTDDLLRYRWVVIVVLAGVVLVDRRLGLSGGLLQSRWTLTGLVTAVFVARVVLRRGASR